MIPRGSFTAIVRIKQAENVDHQWVVSVTIEEPDFGTMDIEFDVGSASMVAGKIGDAFENVATLMMATNMRSVRASKIERSIYANMPFTESERKRLRLALTSKMSAISKDVCNTSWHDGLSFGLWNAIEGFASDYSHLHEDVIGGLRFLRDSLGEWPSRSFNPESPAFVWWPINYYRAQVSL